MNITKLLQNYQISGNIPSKKLTSILHFLQISNKEIDFSSLYSQLDPTNQGHFKSSAFISIYNERLKKKVEENAIIRALTMFGLGEEEPLVNISDQEVRRMFKIFNSDIKEEELREILKRLKVSHGKVTAKEFLKTLTATHAVPSTSSLKKQ